MESRASQVILRAANDSEASLLSTMKEIFKIRADNPCAELYLVELICRAWRQLSDVITEQEEGRVEAKGDAQGTAAVRERNVKRMLAFIHAHYSEPIGVDDIAQSTAISRTECFRCFRSVLNSTPTGYLTEHRLSAAAMLLVSSNRTVADIARSCGFTSSSYFGKLFRAHYGKTQEHTEKIDFCDKCPVHLLCGSTCSRQAIIRRSRAERPWAAWRRQGNEIAGELPAAHLIHHPVPLFVESLGRTEMQEKAGILLKKDVAYCLRSGLRDFFANYAILHLTHFQSSAKTHLLHKAECLPANLAL